jgi:hypothetical protein
MYADSVPASAERGGHRFATSEDWMTTRLAPLTTWPTPTAPLLLLCACLTWGTMAQATEAAPPPQPSASDTPEESALSRTRSGVRSSVEWLASGIDGWFGDIPFSEGGKVTDGELGLTLYKREDDKANLGLRFRARFRLPNLASYQYLFVGNDDRREIVNDQPDTFTRQQQLLRGDNRDNAFFAGVGATLRDNLDVRLGFRGGLKPYAQVRYRHIWDLSPEDRIEFRETVFYSVADQLGSTTALTYEHAISPSLTARWLNAITATAKSKDAGWSSSVGVFKSFGGQRQLSMEALFNGVVGQPVGVQDYGLQMKWSQPIHQDFVIGELIVGHFWPRNDPALPRDRAWAIGTGVKLKF